MPPHVDTAPSPKHSQDQDKSEQNFTEGPSRSHIVEKHQNWIPELRAPVVPGLQRLPWLPLHLGPCCRASGLPPPAEGLQMPHSRPRTPTLRLLWAPPGLSLVPKQLNHLPLNFCPQQRQPDPQPRIWPQPSHAGTELHYYLKTKSILVSPPHESASAGDVSLF